MTALEHTGEWGRSAGSKLGWMIAGRLATALLLSVVGTFWTRSSEASQAINKSLGLVTIVACLTILYALIFRLSKNILRQARFQLAVDILLVTWLVWNSNVIQSPYVALYIVIIAVSSLFLGPREAVVTSVGCAVAFTACSLQITGLMGRIDSTRLVGGSISQTVQWVGLFDVAFLVVGLLSARLAERQSRSDVRLLAATQSLANLRALHERIVASIRSGVVTTDLDGRIFTFNVAAQEITGYQEGTIRGQDASILFGELKDHITETLRALGKGQNSPRFETNCLTSEGMRLRLGYTISPLSSEAGETTGMVITFQDLTQVRSLEETSRRQDRLAAIGRMAASIAHEIRNPLAAMRGSIQMLRAEVDSDSSQAELMEIILRESDRLNRIITDFLSYARPRSLTQARVDVGDLLHQTFALMRHSPEIGANQSIVEELPEPPIFAEADEGQLKQVFWNLARNALQAMPQGGTLRTTLETNSNNRLRISFADTGRGMSPDQVEHLFEPFSSTTGGTGLGLSIVYQIIREHGGTINVRSRVGQGTTITVELPMVAQDE
ncbi:MAG TPA: ATP-binding protein [Pyrinomonadaceae bacterium]|jgi:two-component system sensor histidine kinase PilS (NtrC family)|nr:ATP-binding protein [Pyrinomonadaceae bacterium]